MCALLHTVLLTIHDPCDDAQQPWVVGNLSSSSSRGSSTTIVSCKVLRDLHMLYTAAAAVGGAAAARGTYDFCYKAQFKPCLA
jgi:hypothetical protein